MTARYRQMSQSALFEILSHLQSEPHAKAAAAEAERLVQELQVHQIELELQNRELRQAQNLLEDSRSRYADLFDFAPVGYCTFTEEGDIREINLRAAALMGVDRAQLGKGSVAALLQPDARRQFQEHLRECFGNGRAVVTDLSIRLTEHGPLVVQMASEPVFGLGGRVMASRTTLTDISALKRSERHLRFLVDASKALASSLEYEAALRELVRMTVPDFADVCVLDVLEGDRVRRLEVAFANPDLRELAHELKHALDPVPADSMQAQVLHSRAPLLIFDRSAASLTTAMLKSAGPARSVMFIPLSIRESSFGVMTMAMTESNRVYTSKDLTLALDIGRRAALAMDAGRAYRSAQRATRTRDEVLAVVAHDLRTPLSAITLGTRALLSRRSLDDRRSGRRQLEVIRNSAARMTRLIGDLVDVTRLDSGRLVAQIETHPASTLLSEVAALLQSTALERGVLLQTEPCDPDLTVACDRDRMLQVLGNLADNGIKFSSPGQAVVISAEAHGDRTVFYVRDTGGGITKEALPHVFERRWQASPAQHKGSGLGLYIAKHFVEAQGGSISVESRQDSTAFSVALPARVQRSTRAAVDTGDAGTPRRTSLPATPGF